MSVQIFPAASRGAADHGWLKAKHSFSFAGYYDPLKIHFGMLRVLNDDIIAPGMGFGMHPHDNMEIITIPLSGSIRHHDNMGNEGLISAGDVQVMSAGTGVMHSEFNGSTTEELNLFQLWIFPDKKDVAPRYDQKTFSKDLRHGKFQLLVSADGREDSLMIHQHAYISIVSLTAGEEVIYSFKEKVNGAFCMNVNGKFSCESMELNKRDAAGITAMTEIKFSAASDSEFLIIEVPMQ